MNEKALLYVIMFFLMMVMGRFASGWILREIYDSADLTIEDVYKKRIELRHRKHASRYLTNWIKSVSKDPKRTAKLFRVYHLATLPPIIRLGISVTGLFTHIFDRFLDFASMAVLALTVLTAFANLIFPKQKR